MKCEVCGEREAVRICPRCHRMICDNCTDKRWHLCTDCAGVKNALQEDYLRYVERLDELVRDMIKRLKNPECLHCNVLREAALNYVRAVKELEYLAKKEGYMKLLDRLEPVKKRIYRFALELLIRAQLRME